MAKEPKGKHSSAKKTQREVENGIAKAGGKKDKAGRWDMTKAVDKLKDT